MSSSAKEVGPTLTMSQKYLSLTLRRVGLRTVFWLAELKVSLDINVGALLKVAQIVIRAWVEGQDVVPGSFTLRARCRVTDI